MPLTFSWQQNTPAVPLVTLDDAKTYLRISDTDHDADVTAIRDTAQEAIVAYIGAAADPTWTDATAPRAVVHAIKLLLGHYYEHRGDDLAGVGLRQTITMDDAVWSAISNLLGRHHDPTIAV